MKNSNITVLAAASALLLSTLSATAHEQASPQQQQQPTTQQGGENFDPNRPLSPQVRKGQASDFPKGEMKGAEPVVPVGPPVGRPGVVPVVALERLEGVETVTLDTPQGPVVVISWPVPGYISTSDNNLNFSAMDTNRDGYLARDEVQAMAGQNKVAMQLSNNFQRGDVNNDGRLSMNEVIDWVY